MNYWSVLVETQVQNMWTMATRMILQPDVLYTTATL